MCEALGTRTRFSHHRFRFVAPPAIGEPFVLWQLGDQKQQADIGQIRQRRCPGPVIGNPG
jgi:hypothetical protein